MKKVLFIIAVLCLIISNGLHSQIPEVINYQGLLSDENGNPLADGDYNITLNIYYVSTGGSVLWSETQSIMLRSGVFNVILGKITPINLTFDSQYWLGVTIEGEAELEPRIELTTVPYSFMAKSVQDGGVSNNSIADNSIALRKINTDDASKGQIIKFDGDSLRWSWDLVGGSGSFSLPYKNEVNFPETAFWIIQKGDGTIGRFDIDNNKGSGYAIHATSNVKSDMLSYPTAVFENTADAPAGWFQSDDNMNESPTIYSESSGTGRAGWFSSENEKSTDATLTANNDGFGTAGEFLSNKGTKPVINAEHYGIEGAGLVGRFFQKGAGHGVEIEIDNIDHAKTGLNILSNTELYGGSLALMNMNGNGSGVQINMNKNTNEKKALQITHVGSGVGLDIFTAITKSTAQDKKVASLRVHSSSPNKAPAAYLWGDQNFKGGDVVTILNEGEGKGLSVNITNNLNEDKAVYVKNNGKGTGLEINMNHQTSTSSGLVVNNSGQGNSAYFIKTNGWGDAALEVMSTAGSVNALFKDTIIDGGTSNPNVKIETYRNMGLEINNRGSGFGAIINSENNVGLLVKSSNNGTRGSLEVEALGSSGLARLLFKDVFVSQVISR